MAQLSLDDKREITRRLGYRLEMRDGEDRGALIDPDGRHKGVFRPCKATDLWAWNEAVFRYRLHRRRDGDIYRRIDAAGVETLTGDYARLWPDVGEAETLPREQFEELGGARTLG